MLAVTSRFASITAVKGGAKKVIEFEDDANLFNVLVDAGCLSADGTCQGNLACGKCKVKVASGKVPAVTEEEEEFLEGAPAGTRLACAIVLNGDCDGAVIEC